MTPEQRHRVGPRPRNPTGTTVLAAVKRLLATPDDWTRERYAENARGECVPEFAEDACKFCVLGAIRAVAHEWEPLLADFALRGRLSHEAKAALGLHLPAFVTIWNDDPTTTHDVLVQTIERAAQGVADA